MTKRQRREHKQMIQERKIAILAYKDPLTGKRNKVTWLGGVPQDGKHTIRRTIET